MIAIKLEGQIECANLCNKIQRMITDYAKDNSLENKMLSIKLVDIIHEETNQIKLIGANDGHE